jgi:hypothetical protein
MQISNDELCEFMAEIGGGILPLARCLGYDVSTPTEAEQKGSAVRKWLNGTNPVPGWVGLMVWLHRQNMTRARRIAAKGLPHHWEATC